jgi:hypothetical protein
MIPDPDAKGIYSGLPHAQRPVPYDTLIRVPEGAAMLTFDTCPRCGVAGTEACRCAGMAAAGRLVPGVTRLQWATMGAPRRDPVEPWPHSSAMVQERSPDAGDWARLGWVAEWMRRGYPADLHDWWTMGRVWAEVWDRMAPVPPAAFITDATARLVLRTRED